jgi:GDP-4-dehydro-6-deoxy-D-mannose reductase
LLGADGFVGAHLRVVAEREGMRVVSAGHRPNDGVQACDLRDPASIEACVGAVQPDLVINAAGTASVRESWENPGLAFGTNAKGVLNLLTAMAGKAPDASLVCLSSAEVYGDRGADGLALNEKLAPHPVTPYGTGKMAMEGFCLEFAQALEMRIAVIRVFNLIGPGQRAEFAASGFAKRIVEAERGGEERVELALGNPGAVRDFTDVRDATQALLEISRREILGVFNLCSGRGTSIAELVGELDRATSVDVVARRAAELERPADPSALVGDPTSMREAIGFTASTPLSQTLADLLEWWRSQPAPA